MHASLAPDILSDARWKYHHVERKGIQDICCMVWCMPRVICPIFVMLSGMRKQWPIEYCSLAVTRNRILHDLIICSGILWQRIAEIDAPQTMQGRYQKLKCTRAYEDHLILGMIEPRDSAYPKLFYSIILPSRTLISHGMPSHLKS